MRSFVNIRIRNDRPAIGKRSFTMMITRPPMMHELKCDSLPLHAVNQGRKRFEYRKADRDFRDGDYLFLTEIRDGVAGHDRAVVLVDYILRGPGILAVTSDHVLIETKSKQNYKSEWESADFRAVFEGDLKMSAVES